MCLEIVMVHLLISVLVATMIIETANKQVKQLATETQQETGKGMEYLVQMQVVHFIVRVVYYTLVAVLSVLTAGRNSPVIIFQRLELQNGKE
jgi:uncharacterized membrane protein